MRRLYLFSLSVLLLLTSSCSNEKELLNGENLDNWDKFIGTPLRGFEDLAENATIDNVFTVVDIEGDKLIRISGTVNASLATKASFENYHLKLVFKWGEKVYTRRNSGLLYHSSGIFGAAFGSWMTNIECQLMHDNIGDTFLMDSTFCETSVEMIDERFFYSANGENNKFGMEFKGPGIKKALDAEKVIGEWNTVELYSFGRTTVHVVNGIVTMVNTNTGVNENGVIKPLSSGKIQLQSEGGELFVKSLSIEAIKALPIEY